MHTHTHTPLDRFQTVRGHCSYSIELIQLTTLCYVYTSRLTVGWMIDWLIGELNTG